MIYMKIEVTAEQRRNLIRLAQYLLSDDMKAKFSMEDFSDVPNSFLYTDCGTVGCAVGHGPYAGIPKLVNESWFVYSAREFGVDRWGETYLGFQWMFGGAWRVVDNSPAGAARRIVFFLIKGLPEGFDENLATYSPTLYKRIPFTWPKIIAAFPQLQLPPE